MTFFALLTLWSPCIFLLNFFEHSMPYAFPAEKTTNELHKNGKTCIDVFADVLAIDFHKKISSVRFLQFVQLLFVQLFTQYGCCYRAMCHCRAFSFDFT